MRCWKIPWKNTTVYGSELLEQTINGIDGVVYSGFKKNIKGTFELICLKNHHKYKDVAQLDLLMTLPEILAEKYIIVMDHIEGKCGDVFQCMMDILKNKNIEYRYRSFGEEERLVGVIYSPDLKYISEF